MSEERKLKPMVDDELVDISGGNTYIEWLEDGGFEYWYICPRCSEYKELIATISGNMHGGDISGTIECPKCGSRQDFELEF